MAAQMRAERDVLEHGHVGDQLDVLERARDAAPDDALRRRLLDPLPLRRDLAAVGGQHAGDQVEHRALAGAVRTDQRDDLGRADVERHVVDGNHAAELLARLAHLAATRRTGLRIFPAPAARLRPSAIALA